MMRFFLLLLAWIMTGCGERPFLCNVALANDHRCYLIPGEFRALSFVERSAEVFYVIPDGERSEDRYFFVELPDGPSLRESSLPGVQASFRSVGSRKYLTVVKANGAKREVEVPNRADYELLFAESEEGTKVVFYFLMGEGEALRNKGVAGYLTL